MPREPLDEAELQQHPEWRYGPRSIPWPMRHVCKEARPAVETPNFDAFRDRRRCDLFLQLLGKFSSIRG